MSFLNPFFFIALAAVAIPVIVHFINFRKPREVAFSTLVFFQELQRSTIRRLNFKRYLLLALRVLAITMLVMALARPFLPSRVTGWLGTSMQGEQIAIMIDNGPSMMQIDEAGPYLEQAKNAAKEIVAHSAEDSRFLILPSHGEPESLRLMRKTEALSYIDQFEVQNKGAYPAERMAMIWERLGEEPGSTGLVYWISDARKTQLKKLEDRFEVDPEANDYHPVMFVRVGDGSFQNVAVASVELTGQMPGEGIPTGVSVTIRNFGDQAVHNFFLSLEMDGERIGQYEVDLDAGQEKELLFEVIPESSGSLQGKAILEGGTYTFDHVRYFSIEVPESRNLLLIHDEGEDGNRPSYLEPVLKAVTETGTGIKASFTDISTLREYELDQFDAVILESPRRIPDYLQAELVQFVQQGRGLLFVPSEQGTTENYNRFLRQINAGSFTGMRGFYGRFEEVASLQTLAEGHILIDDIFEFGEDEQVRIDMPDIYHYWRYSSSDTQSETMLLRSNLGDPLFLEQPFGDGRVLIGTMGFSPGWSNLGVKPLYAPLIYRMMLYVAAWEYGEAKEHVLGTPFDRHVADFGTQVVMSLNGDKMHPETSASDRGLRIRYPAREWSPGRLVLELDEKKYSIAVNQNILESDFTSLSRKETERFLEEILPVAAVIDISGYSQTEIQSAMASVSIGREIWNWFIWLAIVFMIAECILSKKYKTQTFAD